MAVYQSVFKIVGILDIKFFLSKIIFKIIKLTCLA